MWTARRPKVGDVVLYWFRDPESLELTGLAAIVTGVGIDYWNEPESVDLAIFARSGILFGHDVECSDEPRVGRWSWPECGAPAPASLAPSLAFAA